MTDLSRRWRIVLGVEIVAVEALLIAIAVTAVTWRDGVPNMSWEAVLPSFLMVVAFYAVPVFPAYLLVKWGGE